MTTAYGHVLRAERIYISGPIAGHPDAEQTFALAARDLTSAGWPVLNPFQIATASCPRDGLVLRDEHDWACYLRHDLIAMLDQCTGVATLDGWQDSRGADLEVHLARVLGMPVKPVEGWLNPGWKFIPVTVAVDTDELRNWAGQMADAGRHGVAHALYDSAKRYDREAAAS